MKQRTLAIVGDSSQDLTFDLARQYGVEVVPYRIQMGDKHLCDLIDMDSTSFYRQMAKYDKLSTGIPPIGDVETLLDDLKGRGYKEVLLMASSEDLTGMIQIYSLLQRDYQGLDLYVFDTHHIAGSACLLTLRAGEMAQSGHSVHEILEELERLRSQTQVFAVFRSLEYLVKGGRFPKYQGILGSLLGIHPILTIDEGQLTLVKKVRGRKASLKALVKQVQASLHEARRYRMVIFSADNAAEVNDLKLALAGEIEEADTVIETDLTPVLGVHAGPGCLGVAVMVLD